MDDTLAKQNLLRYLQTGRDALLWKLEGVSEYDLRRPLVPTGTNLLGIVKHTAGVEAGYLGLVFGRPFPEPLPYTADDAEPNSDMWATLDESRDDIVALYRRIWAHSNATVEALPLDAPGSVPWWPEERRDVTLMRILPHLIAETHRHAGHADLVRELVDGSAGLQKANDNLPPGGPDFWPDYRARLEDTARAAAAAAGEQAPAAAG
ncbi:DinB family protein [Subtercola sp. YIM 133946]|uniref:DinB family protein n=1 Tax=Subtercola sp. YIM 133946 TaxID=3118909 RepID=UPI002F9369B9